MEETAPRLTLYLTTQGCQLRRVGDAVRVTRDGEELERQPVAALERVLVFGNAQLTSAALGLLAEAGVDVSLLSSHGRFRARLVAPANGNVFLRLAQHARHASPPYRIAFARTVVAAKLTSARAVLLRYGRRHPAAELTETTDKLKALRASVEECDAIDRLMGIEGAGAAAYFRAFAGVVPPPFAFGGRSAHPARDEPNALLNLGYTLVGNEIAGRLEAAGFDPQLGLYHGVRYGRHSLSLDLLEEHRAPVVDRLTLSLLNRRVFAKEDFVATTDNGIRLTPAALRRYLHHFESSMGTQRPADVVQKVPPPRARIAEQVARLRDALLDGTSYEAWSLPS